MHRVRFEPGSIEIDVPEETTISAAARSAGIWLDAPCGGNGTCKKCFVMLTRDGISERVLACQTRIFTDCVVHTPLESTLAALDRGVHRAVAFSPFPEANRTPGACFAAFDLGTTTIVCYLLDANTGAQLAARGTQNPQAAYGADVISRAAYALEHGYEPLRLAAAGALDALLAEACYAAGRSMEQVTLCSIVGNSVMLHLLLGYPVDSLVRAPYQPYRVAPLVLPASELGLRTHASCRVLIPPAVGGFVGADTVACLTAASFGEQTEAVLLLDIGTNGELALTDGRRRVCCSTAAGPAFEGANISCGMRARPGAIDHAWLENGALRLSSIDGAPIIGICGSGLVELAALLAQEGIIDESGRLRPMGSLAARIVGSGAQTAFLLTEHGADGTPLYLTQRDVRELQLGKAALRAGIELLCQTLSLTPEQIARVLIAGAFGSRLAPDALCSIGLLPASMRDRLESIGNAAGEGAKLYLRSYELFLQAESLAHEIAYLELTTSADFTERYVDALTFPPPSGPG